MKNLHQGGWGLTLIELTIMMTILIIVACIMSNSALQAIYKARELSMAAQFYGVPPTSLP